MVAKRLGTPYVPGIRSDDWRKIINWSYHDVIVSKVTFRPLKVQLRSVDGNYLGSVTIDFTKEVKEKIFSTTPPYHCKVKARGWTSVCKLRLPQKIAIEYSGSLK